jgi:hypothetical protein
MRVGWWQSTIMHPEGEEVIWEKEMVNMYPEGFISKKSNTNVTVVHQGTYMISFYANYLYEEEEEQVACLVINEEKIRYEGKKIMRLDKNTKIGLLSKASENYLCIQKL